MRIAAVVGILIATGTVVGSLWLLYQWAQTVAKCVGC